MKSGREDYVLGTHQLHLLDEVAARFGHADREHTKAAHSQFKEVGKNRRWTASSHKDSVRVRDNLGSAIKIGQVNAVQGLAEVLQFHFDDLGENMALASFQVGEFVLKTGSGGDTRAKDMLKIAAQFRKAVVAYRFCKAHYRGFADTEAFCQFRGRKKDGVVVIREKIGSDLAFALGQLSVMLFNPPLELIEFVHEVRARLYNIFLENARWLAKFKIPLYNGVKGTDEAVPQGAAFFIPQTFGEGKIQALVLDAKWEPHPGCTVTECERQTGKLTVPSAE
jgi:hypothetical protein